jgi:beta-barrel assembly-enhancing protease
MKRPLVLVLFFAILGTSLAGLYWSQRHGNAILSSANAVVDMMADAQRDATRVPMHLTRVSDEQEIEIGRRLAANYAGVERQLTPEEEALRKYMQRVGGTVAAHAHRRLPYEFHLIPNRNFINAFALPGGPVYIGEGMLYQMETEDELANILGHEVEHIDHYHCIERYQLEAPLKKIDLEVVGQLLQLPLDFWEAGYHKDEESEADREGMALAVDAGYSPYGAVTLFTRLGKLSNEYIVRAQTPEQELSELAIQSLEGYFRSHPQPSERLAQANELIVQRHWQDRKTQRPFVVEYEVHDGEPAN